MNSSQHTRARNRRLWIAGVGLVASAAWGCSAIKVGLGERVRLEKMQVSKMEVKLADAKGIAPGQRMGLIVTVTQPDGKVLVTEGRGGGKVMWKDLNVDGDLVAVDDKGNIRLAEDPRTSDGKTGRVIVTASSHPGLRAQIDVPVRYDFAFVSDFSGRAGMDGSSGMDGTDGTSGSTGSIDPNNPSPGGNGGNGTNGWDGHDGDPGGSAPKVSVLVALRDLGHPFFWRLRYKRILRRDTFLWTHRAERLRSGQAAERADQAAEVAAVEEGESAGQGLRLDRME